MPPLFFVAIIAVFSLGFRPSQLWHVLFPYTSFTCCLPIATGIRHGRHCPSPRRLRVTGTSQAGDGDRKKPFIRLINITLLQQRRTLKIAELAGLLRAAGTLQVFETGYINATASLVKMSVSGLAEALSRFDRKILVIATRHALFDDLKVSFPYKNRKFRFHCTAEMLNPGHAKQTNQKQSQTQPSAGRDLPRS